jgi:hypothetical protein
MARPCVLIRRVRLAHTGVPHPEVRQRVGVVSELVQHHALATRFHRFRQVSRNLHLPRRHAD